MNIPIYKFIGDDKDTITEKMGIHTGESYKIWLEFNFISDSVIAHIFTEDKSIICPYRSAQIFNNNWQLA